MGREPKARSIRRRNISRLAGAATKSSAAGRRRRAAFARRERSRDAADRVGRDREPARAGLREAAAPAREAIGHEWQALRRVHEARQAAAPGSGCAERSRRLGGESRAAGIRAGRTRLDAFETNLQPAEPALGDRADRARRPSARASAPGLPEERDAVSARRRHAHSRRSSDDVPEHAPETQGALAIVPRELPDSAAGLSARVESLEREVTIERQEATTPRRAPRSWAHGARRDLPLGLRFLARDRRDLIAQRR